MTWPLAIKLYALLSLLCVAAWAVTGWRWSKRKDAIRDEYRWHMSKVILHEPDRVIRAEEIF